MLKLLLLRFLGFIYDQRDYFPPSPQALVRLCAVMGTDDDEEEEDGGRQSGEKQDGFSPSLQMDALTATPAAAVM